MATKPGYVAGEVVAYDPDWPAGKPNERVDKNLKVSRMGETLPGFGGTKPSAAPKAVPAANVRTYTPAVTLAQTGREYSLALAGANEVIPDVYGQARVSARIALATVYQNALYLLCVWCKGEISIVGDILVGDAVHPPASVHSYTGTNAQVADPWLTAAIAGYADTLAGICYSVLRFNSTDSINSRIEATIQGRKDVYDPRGPSTGYSDNPALCLANFLSRYTNHAIDWTSVGLVATDNDELVTGAKRRTLNLALEEQTTVMAWADTLREYAGCFIQWTRPIKLTSNRPRAVDHVITEANIIGTPTITKRGLDQQPNRVTAEYINTTTTLYQKATVSVSSISANEETREQRIPLYGFNSQSLALRQVTERLNYYRLTDLSIALDLFDEGLKIAIGDVLSVTHSLGLYAKQFRVLDCSSASPGRWAVQADEYSPNIYSDSVQNDPTYTDTELPVPSTPPTVTGITLTEVNFRLQNGLYASRIKATWNAVIDPYLSHYRVRVLQGSKSIWSMEDSDTELSTGALQELTPYTVEVTAINPFYEGVPATATIELIGKYAVPDGPAWLDGFEVAGEVRLHWPADTSDFDIQRYEIRWGATNGSWATATVLNVTDTLRLNSRDVPPGTWRFYVKSIDSVRQYSTNAPHRDITVTLDNNAYLIGDYEFQTGSTTFMHQTQEVRGGPAVFYSTGGQSWGDVFGSQPLSAFAGAPLMSHLTPQGESRWESDEFDPAGINVTGDWRSELEHIDLTGVAVVEMGLRPDGGEHQYFNVLSQKTSARYAAMRAYSTGLFHMEVPGPYVRVDVVAREESGVAGSSAVGPAKVTLSGTYVAVKSIVITPLGTEFRAYSVDNIDFDPVLGTSFDVYIWNELNALIDTQFQWLFKGV